MMDQCMDRFSRSFFALQRDVLTFGMSISIGRKVSAARARKLRKRGEYVQHAGMTKTGKTLYTWVRRIPPFSIYKEQR